MTASAYHARPATSRPLLIVGCYRTTGGSRAERDAYHLLWLHRPAVIASRARAFAEDERAGGWRPDFGEVPS